MSIFKNTLTPFILSFNKKSLHLAQEMRNFSNFAYNNIRIKILSYVQNLKYSSHFRYNFFKIGMDGVMLLENGILFWIIVANKNPDKVRLFKI